MSNQPRKFEWKVTRENLERLGIKNDGSKISNFMYNFVKNVGDRVSDIAYGAAGGREPDQTERQEIAEQRKHELEKRRAELKAGHTTGHSQKQ